MPRQVEFEEKLVPFLLQQLAVERQKVVTQHQKVYLI